MTGDEIVYVANSVIPSRTANSVHVMKMCAAFAEQGLSVTLLVPDRSREYEEDVSDIFAFYGVPRSFRVKKVAWSYGRFGWAGFALRTAWRLMGSGRRLIVFTRFMPLALLLACLRRPSILEMHAPYWAETNFKWRIFSRAIGRRGIVGMVVISHPLKTLLQRVGIRADRVLVAHDAAGESDAMAIRPDWPGRPGALQIGYVGGLYEGKGLEVVQRVAGLVASADFHVIGGRKKDIEIWRSRIPHANVYFHGFVPHAEISASINRLDVCLLPNQEKVSVYAIGGKGGDIGQYTSPLKMFEYLAHGKAIVASDLPVLREVLDPEIAVLVDPTDFAGWARAIESLKDPEVRRTLEMRGLERFRRFHTWSARASRILDFVRTCELVGK